jgi:uncharacterized membrane protein
MRTSMSPESMRVAAVPGSTAASESLGFHSASLWAVDLTEGSRHAIATKQEASVDRLIMFSDGVMAIAITLLILPLTGNEPARGASVATVAIENLGALIGFAVPFAVIANYWSIHHAIFRPVRHHNSWLVLLNMLWLAAIVFLPFPTSLIEGGLDGGFATLYISNLRVISVLNLLIANYLVHHPEITDGESAAESRRHVIASVFNIGALVIAVVISLFWAAAGMWALFLLFPAQMIAERVTGRPVQTRLK